MKFEEVIEKITNNEFDITAVDLVNAVTAFVMRDDVIDCSVLQEIIASLQSIKKSAKEDYKIIKKQKDEEEKIKNSEIGKKYFDALNVGEQISWKKADGTIVYGTKAKQKKEMKTAHVLINETSSAVKNPRYDRYIKYHNIIVPEEFEN